VKRFAVAAVVTLGGFAVGVACGEPYEGEIPIPAEAGTDASDGGAVTDAGIDSDGAPPFDAASDAPAADASCNLCDCDGDGFVTKDAAVCPDASGAPRSDCDDLDTRANPDAGFSKEVPTVETKGDWNCDGVTNREFPFNVKCSENGSVGCTSIAGFKDDPPCGSTGQFVTCQTVGGVFCGEATTTTVVQRCK
jgi:hypothetical protein